MKSFVWIINEYTYNIHEIKSELPTHMFIEIYNYITVNDKMISIFVTEVRLH